MSNITAALFSLGQQSVARGLGGRLEDCDIQLAEDNKTVSVWSHYDAAPPLMASFELTAEIEPSAFDAEPYYRAAFDFTAKKKTAFAC